MIKKRLKKQSKKSSPIKSKSKAATPGAGSAAEQPFNLVRKLEIDRLNAYLAGTARRASLPNSSPLPPESQEALSFYRMRPIKAELPADSVQSELTGGVVMSDAAEMSIEQLRLPEVGKRKRLAAEPLVARMEHAKRLSASLKPLLTKIQKGQELNIQERLFINIKWQELAGMFGGDVSMIGRPPKSQKGNGRDKNGKDEVSLKH